MSREDVHLLSVGWTVEEFKYELTMVTTGIVQAANQRNTSLTYLINDRTRVIVNHLINSLKEWKYDVVRANLCKEGPTINLKCRHNDKGLMCDGWDVLVISWQW